MYPENKAEATRWDDELGVNYSLVSNPGTSFRPQGHYCGYARFYKFGYSNHLANLQEQGCRGILTYVPVHGGITYNDVTPDSYVYGFDCAHLNDEVNSNLRNPEWLFTECRKMALSIILAAQMEKAYLIAEDEDRVNILQDMHDKLSTLDIHFTITNNFGAMINLICGKL